MAKNEATKLATEPIVAAIERSDDLGALDAISAAAAKRAKAVRAANLARAVAEKWERVRNWRDGDAVWCCTTGVFLGGKIQRGTKLTVVQVQPRARRVWLRLGNGKPFWFSAETVHRYALSRNKPEPLSPEAEASHAATRRLGKLLGG